MSPQNSFFIDNPLSIGQLQHKIIFQSQTLLFNSTNISTTANIPSFGGCNISQTGTIENIAYAIFMVLILLSSLIGNSLVVVASLMSKQLRNRVTIYFIISLAFSDLALAVCQIPFIISMKLYQQFCHNVSACYWMIASDAFCNVASILNLFLIAIDRFIAIRMPFRYNVILSAKRSKKLIACVWIFSAIWSIIGLFRWKEIPEFPGTILSVHKGRTAHVCSNKNYYYYAASYFGIYLMTLAIMTITYLAILLTALRQIKVIESTRVVFQQQENSDVIVSRERQISNDLEKHRKARNRKRKKELKATKSVAIVYFAFVICWFPSCVINIMIMFNDSYFPELRNTNETLFLFIFYLFIQILPMVNTMINPLIYSFSNKQFRIGFRSVYRRALRKLDSPESSLDSTSRKSRTQSNNNPMSPTTSCSSSSRDSVDSNNHYSTSRSVFKNTVFVNVKGAYTNSCIEEEHKATNVEAIWKPD